MAQTFLDAYIACALWFSVDDDGEPFGHSGYNADDIAPETLATMSEECRQFQADHAADLAQAGNESQNGHDFWLTRNRHGAGFWDRGYRAVGHRLTDAAHVWGSVNLYIGDDGKLYQQ